MITRKDIEELGWIVKFDKIVLFAQFQNYSLYFNQVDNFTIHKDDNGNLEHALIFKGHLELPEELEQVMLDKGII